MILQQFGPEIILVSAGFDASIGHLPPLGGYKVSPACFGHMTKELMRICDGKVSSNNDINEITNFNIILKFLFLGSFSPRRWLRFASYM